MAKKRLIRLSWVDAQGEPYHEETGSPEAVREQLKRAGVFMIRFPGNVGEHPLRHLTYAEIQRSSRGAVGTLERGRGTVIITLEGDN